MVMPVRIGATAHSFSDPTGLLSDCHRRIEMFLATLKRVADAIDRAPAEELARALEAALRYFREAAPKHTADEEESLFPRLRQIANPEVSRAFSQLDKLEEEHQWANALHSEVEQLGAKYLAERTLPANEVARFRAAIRDLQSMYERHISIEDNTIFPLAARLFNDTDKFAIAVEMVGRRKA